AVPAAHALERLEPVLNPHGVAVRAVEPMGPGVPPPGDVPVELLASIPAALLDQVLGLHAELLDLRPEVLHCWLDEANIVGAIAGLLADVPCIRLSLPEAPQVRSARLAHSHVRVWYRLLVASRRISVACASPRAAERYATWLDLPQESFCLLFPEGRQGDPVSQGM